MSDNKTIRFPNGGYEVIVVEKEDILNTIEQNITDKEIMNELITQLELDISKFIKENKWTGVPFLGSIRVPPVKAYNKQYQEEKNQAYLTMPKKEYIVFTRQMAFDAERIVKHNRLYKYIASMACHKNIKEYREVARKKGDTYAKLYFYFKVMVKAVDNEFVEE